MRGAGCVLRCAPMPVLGSRAPTPPSRCCRCLVRVSTPSLTPVPLRSTLSAPSLPENPFLRQPRVRHPQTPGCPVGRCAPALSVSLPACPPAHGFVKDVNCHVTPLHPFSKGLGFWRKAMKLI